MRVASKYGQLESQTYTLGAADVFDLLKKGGHVPEGFALDYTADTSNFPIEIEVRRYTENTK